MTKNLRQVKKVPTRPQVAHRKRVAKGMGRETHSGDAQLLPEYTEIPFKVPNGNLRVVLCAKKYPTSAFLYIPPKRLAKFIREGYEPMFTPFTEYLQNETLKVHIFFRKAQDLRSTKPGVANRERHSMSPDKIPAFGPKAEEMTKMFFG